MTSIIQYTSEPFTDTALPKLGRVPSVNKGSRLRLDFTNAYTLNGLTSASSLANGSVFKNLVDGSTDASTVGFAGNVAIGSGNRGLVVATGNSGTTSYLDFGYGNLDMYEVGNHSYIWHMWANEAATGQLSGNVINARSGNVGNADTPSPIFGDTPSPLTLAGTGGSRVYNAYSRYNGVAPTLSTGASPLSGVAHLLSYAWTPGATSLYVDGALVAGGSGGALTPSFRSHATATAAGNVSAGQTETINGTAITFVASGATGNQVNIGADAAATLVNLRTFINANTVALTARAEFTAGQANTVLSVFRTDAGMLTLATTAPNITHSSITTPYGYRGYIRNILGTTYALGLDDLTLNGMTPAQAAAREYALFRPVLTALGIA